MDPELGEQSENLSLGVSPVLSGGFGVTTPLSHSPNSGETGPADGDFPGEYEEDDVVYDSDDEVTGEYGWVHGRHDRDWVAEWVRSVTRARTTRVDLPPLVPQLSGKGVHFRAPSPVVTVSTSPSTPPSTMPGGVRGPPPQPPVTSDRPVYLGGFGVMGLLNHSSEGRRSSPSRRGVWSERSMRSNRTSFRTAPSDHLSHPPATRRGDKLSWPAAALVLYAFGMPAAVGGAAHAVGAVGWVAAVPLCIVSTGSAAAGGWMIAEVARAARSNLLTCNTFADVGFVTFGGLGKVVGGYVQAAHLALSLPILLALCGDGVEGVATGLTGVTMTPGWGILLGGLLCWGVTQVRFLKSHVGVSMILCIGTAIAAFAMIAATMIFPRHPLPPPPYPVGNPEGDSLGGLTGALTGVSIITFCYVPSFLSAELSGLVSTPRDLSRAFFVSALLSCVTELMVGFSVVSAWGWQVPYPATKSELWPTIDSSALCVNLLMLACNMANYCTSASCLGRASLANWNQYPKQGKEPDKWVGSVVLRYVFVTGVLTTAAAAVAHGVGSLPTLVTAAAFATVPAAAQLYPAACFSGYFLFPNERGGSTTALGRPLPAAVKRKMGDASQAEARPLLSSIPRVQSGSIHESEDHYDAPPQGVDKTASSFRGGQATTQQASTFHGYYSSGPVGPSSLGEMRSRGVALPVLTATVGGLSLAALGACFIGRTLLAIGVQ
eukprot:Hpha_TRINITY_DN15702_c2_g1::TRINITY_DN15702_c2_g1_i1::g.37887::m.37887